MGRHRHAVTVRADGLGVVLGPLLNDPRVVLAALVDVDSGMVLDACTPDRPGGQHWGADLEMAGAGHAELARVALALPGRAGPTPAGDEVVVSAGPGRHHLVLALPDPHGGRLALSVVVDGSRRLANRVLRKLRAVPAETLTAGPTPARRPGTGGWVTPVGGIGPADDRTGPRPDDIEEHVDARLPPGSMADRGADRGVDQGPDRLDGGYRGQDAVHGSFPGGGDRHGAPDPDRRDFDRREPGWRDLERPDTHRPDDVFAAVDRGPDRGLDRWPGPAPEPHRGGGPGWPVGTAPGAAGPGDGAVLRWVPRPTPAEPVPLPAETGPRPRPGGLFDPSPRRPDHIGADHIGADHIGADSTGPGLGAPIGLVDPPIAAGGPPPVRPAPPAAPPRREPRPPAPPSALPPGRRG